MNNSSSSFIYYNNEILFHSFLDDPNNNYPSEMSEYVIVKMLIDVLYQSCHIFILASVAYGTCCDYFGKYGTG